ncbi:MAG: DUF2254 domain-containing protein [Actinomycetota bacterium]|nr:DUF2254 domain-containing protein [Actinomycetota bacterium]
MAGGISLSHVRDEARTRLWPLPVVALVLAVALGIGLPRLDAAIDDDLPGWLTVYLFGGGASAARTILGTIATSLISVTSLTFSLTVVTLQLASSQFSPRLLRTFTRDRFVHVTLALFLASFVYALTVLRTVRTAEERGTPFVPQLAVTLAFMLAIASVLGLVLFLAHLTRDIRVETILRNVHQDATGTIENVLRSRSEPAVGPSPPRRPADGVVALVAPESGFLIGLDGARLCAAARDVDAVVVIEVPVGSALVANTPLGVAWSRSSEGLGDDDRARLQRGVARGLQTGFERTSREDVGFGMRQLVDVAIRALSPSLNDPTTAAYALNHSAALLCELLGRELDPRVVSDEEDTPRVVQTQYSFADLLELAISQPRHYGSADPLVADALLDLLNKVAWVADDPADLDAIESQLARLRAALDRHPFDEEQRTALRAREEAVSTTLTRPRRTQHHDDPRPQESAGAG